MPSAGVRCLQVLVYAFAGSVLGCGADVVPWDTANRHPSTAPSLGRYVGPPPANAQDDDPGAACQ
jgi:hypothetical protein